MVVVEVEVELDKVEVVELEVVVVVDLVVVTVGLKRVVVVGDGVEAAGPRLPFAGEFTEPKRPTIESASTNSNVTLREEYFSP